MWINLFKYFRTTNWWNFIFPPILGIAYFTMLINHAELSEYWVELLLFFISFLFTASFGFFLNDITDIEEDSKANKQNMSSKFNPGIRYTILLSILILAIIPWFFIKNSYPAILFFIMQLILLFSYSVKPFRLKRFAFTAILSDAMYSSFVPALIALFLFYFSINLLSYAFICILALFFLRGLRNILIHQILDKNNDEIVRLNTFVTKYGIENTFRLIQFIILPIELVFICLMILGLIVNIQFSWIIIPIGIIFYLIKLFDAKAERNNKILKLQLINDFYEDIFPLVFLILLSVNDFYFLIILALHVIIFKNKVLWLTFPWIYYKLFCNKYVKDLFGR